MRALTPEAISEAFLKNKLFLLLDKTAFDARCVGNLLARSIITSKGGIALPPEISLEVFGHMLSGQHEWLLVRPLSVTCQGKDAFHFHCRVYQPQNDDQLACIVNDSVEVEMIERYLASPDDAENHDLIFVYGEGSTEDFKPFLPSRDFTIMIYDHEIAFGKVFKPDCLFYSLTVPDLLSRLSEFCCGVCDGRKRHTICPECFGGSAAEQYHGHMGCDVELACRVCLDLDLKREDQTLLQTYIGKVVPREVEEARERRFRDRLKELGY